MFIGCGLIYQDYNDPQQCSFSATFGNTLLWTINLNPYILFCVEFLFFW